MGYLLLTGGTGLLGEYLVRDLLNRGIKLALLVRSSRKASAHQRVEALLARWEEECGLVLPRPVVLEGDLTEENLGLDAADLRWIARNAHTALHNAASLTFQAAGPDGEPWRSNLQGTQHVLDVCRQTGIRKLHHVSTAYVCGLRTGRILESELDAGQQHGNDYEISKFRAELLVREAAFLDRPTIYRPSIILGDSQTGYTSTFYGFYAPLKLMSTMLSKAAGVASTREELVAHIGFASQHLTQILNLAGDERKNYVPVDWVSAVMAHIITRPQHHGKTYHLTPAEPVKVALTRRAIEQAFEKYTELAERKTHSAAEWSEFERYFTEGMKVYQAYWRDDPLFDTTNTRAAAGHLACPELDAGLFLRTCQFAIESNFGRKTIRRTQTPPIDVREKMSPWTRWESVDNNSLSQHVGLQVDGAGGGQWELVLADGRLVAVDPGISERCRSTLHLDSQTFASLAADTTTAEEALEAGHVSLEGNGRAPNGHGAIGLPTAILMQALEEAAGTRAGANAR
jgi:thioester reductase-like protein